MLGLDERNGWKTPTEQRIASLRGWITRLLPLSTATVICTRFLRAWLPLFRDHYLSGTVRDMQPTCTRIWDKLSYSSWNEFNTVRQRDGWLSWGESDVVIKVEIFGCMSRSFRTRYRPTFVQWVLIVGFSLVSLERNGIVGNLRRDAKEKLIEVNWK